MVPRLRTFGRWPLLLIVFLFAAETAARLDDWLHLDVPLLANPERDHDLTVWDNAGKHGRSHGRYKKWKLNSYGFRGPEISETPEPGVTRILILGASETFGLYESEGKEYPAQLAQLLRDKQGKDLEVVNGAMAGITVKRMLPYWKKWLSRFHPHVVLIYPSPLLYLDEVPPAIPRDDVVDLSPEPGWSSRVAGRFKDALRQTVGVRWLRQELLLALSERGKGDDWYFRTVPEDRLNLFLADLAALTEAIQSDGAEPILVTHAIRATSPPRADDAADLRAMRLFMPRATNETLVAFEDAASTGMKAYGREQGIPVFDAAQHMNGKREWFADLVHFNDAGAGELAALLAKRIRERRLEK
jgi:lysophospholipase L1-like esterase